MVVHIPAESRTRSTTDGGGEQQRVAAPARVRPGVDSPEAVLALQRAAGNRAVGRSLKLARQIELRDVGKGEQSGFARLPELIDRLNSVSPSLIYSMDGNKLAYRQVEGLDPDGFDNQMMALIDRAELVPVRLTNRHGLLGDKVSGFHDEVDGDAFFSGYADIDDILACDDLGFELLLVHFLTERAVTKNYAKRIGIDDPAKGGFTDAEFQRSHSKGNQAEVKLLQDFFGDPTIKLVSDSNAAAFRVFKNSRGDFIREIEHQGKGAEKGVQSDTVEVTTTDKKKHTPDEYKAILDAARDAAAAAAP
jgi:hypothetical protein